MGYKNPLSYRGYFYDNESGLYYVTSRYYNPEIGRFLNADGLVSTGQGLLGQNMFAYGGNNPVNNTDPSGYFFENIFNFAKKTCKAIANMLTVAKSVTKIPTTVQKIEVASIFSVVSGSATINDVTTDAKNYNFFNRSENIVLNSNVFSSYKGTPVIRHSLPNITSFSISNTIVLNSREKANRDGILTVKHEWGHNVQDTVMGTPNFITRIAVPSIIGCVINPSSQTYYSFPWERSADFFGGAYRGMDSTFLVLI